MLRPLRWKLTLLYLLAAIGLVGLMGIGTYLLIDRYFQQTTDLTLEYKMASEFRQLGLSVPPELLRSETLWLQNNSRTVPQPSPPATTDSTTEDDHHSESDEGESNGNETEQTLDKEEFYNADLAAVFVIPLDTAGIPFFAPNLVAPPVVDSPEAISNAKQVGYDLRTVDLPGRGRLRLLTYRTGATVPALLQTGRLLNDQDRILSQYLVYLV